MSKLPLGLQVRSGLPGLRFPALPVQGVLPRWAMFQQLESTQWLDNEVLAHGVFGQLEVLLEHVRHNVPGYRGALAEAGLATHQPLTAEAWRRLPILTRRRLQDAGDALVATTLPTGHGAIATSKTSGSTGEPVVVHRSGLNQIVWEALLLRDHAWHRRDLSGTLCALRYGLPEGQEIGADNWGGPTAGLFDTGPAYAMNIDTDIRQQAEWLRRRDPHYLLNYPSNMAALCDALPPRALPRLREIRTIAETLGDELRNRIATHFGVPVSDAYSSNEIGFIASQCPRSGLYHIHADTVLVEVLDDAGRPCAPGEIGRVIATPLHSFAQPLLRYELRDHAEVGPPCPCGRGLPTLRRILGRTRNLVRLPDGSRHWPLVGFAGYRDIAPIRQYQLVQQSLTQIDVRLVVDAPLTDAQQAALRALVCRSLRHDFDVRFACFDGRLPPATGGKFEEFVCAIPD